MASLLPDGEPLNPSPARPGLTAQQDLAVNRREVSIVLSSGAGCGKTHVLTERYLSHLRDDGAEVGQIVAITFTDRAARQMRARIRAAVSLEMQQATQAEELERWSRHLQGLETAQISTIHSFCSLLLRQHAVEAGLDPRFEVLDEVLAANFRTEAHVETLQELLTSATIPGEDLRALVLLYGWRPVVAAVEHLVLDHDAAAWNPWLTLAPEEVAQQWLEDERRHLLPSYVDYLLAANPRISRCLKLLAETPCTGPQTRVNVECILTLTPSLAEAPNLAEAVTKVVESAKVNTNKERATAWPSEEVYETVKEVFEGFRGELKERFSVFVEEPVGVADAVVVAQRFLRVAQEAVRAYQRRKRRAGVVDFQDLLMAARDLLRGKNEVREALQRRYRFLLVDELQDTDPIQMEVVEHLCGGGLTAGRLFGVGDLKQSIYRFRGADVHLFQRLRQRMPHDGRLGLTLNFRSQPEILDFANALFSRRIPDYEPLRAHRPQVNTDSCVEFLWTPRVTGESVAQAREREADTLARRIALMTEGERLVADHRELRRVRAGDVVLLFRSMSQVAIYEAALRHHGLDYYLVGGRAFFAQQEIYDILNLLRALENPCDDVSLAGTLRSPFCCVSDEALFLLGRGREALWGSLHEETRLSQLPEADRPIVERARRHLEQWRALKDRLPIARLLGTVLADSGYDASLQFETLGDRKMANLWKLLDMARTFDRSGLFGLAEFIGRLGDLVSRLPREEQAATLPENADVVRLMTIHQAKGLEFPIVFLLDLAARTGGGPGPVALWDRRLGGIARPPADEDPIPFPEFGVSLWKAREAVEEWQEDLRTFYVACTRAQDYLVLSAAMPESMTPETAGMLALAERFDLRTGVCLASEVPVAQRPRVRVTVSLPPRIPTGGALSTIRRQAPLLGTGEAAAEPIPARLLGKRLFTVAEVERALGRSRGRGRSQVWRPEEVAHQFHREDGADLRSWDPAPGSDADRLARRVLDLWDYRDPKSLLSLLAGTGYPLEDPARQEAERMLRRFATSRVCEALVRALSVASHREYLLSPEMAPGLFAATERPAVRGTLDLTWEDANGGHSLLVFGSGPSKTGQKRTWPLALVLGACLWQRQFGEWPVGVWTYDLETGGESTTEGGSLDHQATLERVASALSDLQQKQIVDTL